jgi:hypothetical protein
MTEGEQIKVNCASCHKATKHFIRKAYKFEEIINLREYGMNGTLRTSHEYLTVQCAGCENVSFLDIADSGGGTTVYQYPEIRPKELQGLFLDHNELDKLPKDIALLYEEVSVAFTNHTSILAGIGLRTLVEAICVQQKIQVYNLHLKIKELHNRGLISKQELPIIDKLRTIGNTAAHKIKPANEDTLRHALLIVNHVLRSVYILPGFSKKIKL